MAPMVCIRASWHLVWLSCQLAALLGSGLASEEQEVGSSCLEGCCMREAAG